MYFSSVLKPIGHSEMHILLPLHLFISVGHTQSYFLTCLYRMTYATAFNKIQSWFENPMKLEGIALGLLVVFSTIIVGKI